MVENIKIVSASRPVPKTPEETLEARKSVFHRHFNIYSVLPPGPLAREGYSNPNKNIRECYDLSMDIPKAKLIPSLVSDQQYASSGNNKANGVEIGHNTYLSQEDYAKISSDAGRISNGIRNIVADLEAQYEQSKGRKGKITSIQPVLNFFEKGDNRIYALSTHFFSHNEFLFEGYSIMSEDSKFQNPNYWMVVVSTSRETDNDAFALANYYQRLGVNCAIVSFEQNPQNRKKNPGLHMKEKIAALSTENAELRSSLEGSRQQIEQALADLESAKNAISTSNTALGEQTNLRATLEESIRNLGNQAQQLSVDLENANQSIAKLKNENAQQAQELSARANELAVANRTIKSLASTMQEAISNLSGAGLFGAKKAANEAASLLEASLALLLQENPIL